MPERERCHYTLKWDEAERQEVRRHNARLWARVKREHGSVRVLDIPGFRECIEEMHGAGYSTTDISAVFGFTRERGRQVVRAAGLSATKGAKLRFWSDKKNRFVTTKARPADLLREASKLRAAARRREGRRRREARRPALAARVRELAEQLGRPPKVREVVEATGLTIPTIAWIWGRPLRGGLGGYTEALDRLYDAAGVEGRRGPGRGGGRTPDRAARRKDQVAKVRELAERLDRPPRMVEVSRATGLAYGTIAADWGKDEVVGYTEALDRLYDAAGVLPRPGTGRPPPDHSEAE